MKVLFVFSTHWSWGLFCLENQNSLSEARICCLEISHWDIFIYHQCMAGSKLHAMCAVLKLYLPSSTAPPSYSSSLLGFPCGPLHPFPEHSSTVPFLKLLSPPKSLCSGYYFTISSLINIYQSVV